MSNYSTDGDPAMDRLTLPEPAAGLWRKAAPALERALGQTERPPARWSIGGGTILARRWGHRESTDIDLTVPAGTGTAPMPEHSAMTQHYGRAAANRRRT